MGEIERSGSDEEKGIWGTWEELLLSSAVSRHGTRSWDSVAMEVRSRSHAARFCTPADCQKRFGDLRLRFAGDSKGRDETRTAGGPPPEVPWLEEIRQLRVAELRREVERYDVSIGYLELKVKRLKEERDRGNVNCGFERLDLKEEDKSDAPRTGSAPAEIVAADRISSRSCKESNSTDQKYDDVKHRNETGNAGESSGAAIGTADLDNNGSSDPANAAAAAKGGESGESIAESKESAEVQSSSGIVRRRGPRGRRRGGGGIGGGGEVGTQNFLWSVGGSQPLITFLEIVRSNPSGSIFENRLDSQDSESYRSAIRRHVDLGMVRSAIERLGEAYTKLEFRRDLMLLCANALAYYEKGSTEFIAAMRVRDLISKEFDEHFVDKETPNPSLAVLQAMAPPAVVAPPLKSKTEQVPISSLLEKSAVSSIPIIACRKRSAVSTRASALVTVLQEDEEMLCVEKKIEEVLQEEEVVDDLIRANAKTRVRSLRKEKLSLITQKVGVLKSSKPVRVISPVMKEKEADVSMKTKKKNSGGSAVMVKKRSVAKFLEQIKRGSQDDGTTLLESLKNSRSNASSAGNCERQSMQHKKTGRAETRRKQNLSRAKPTPELSPPAKRSVGRPPKNAPSSLPIPRRPKQAKLETESTASKPLPPSPPSPPLPPARKRKRR